MNQFKSSTSHTLLTASHRTFSISCCDPKNVRTRDCHAVLHIRTHSSPSNCHPQIRYLDSQSNAMQINKIYLPNKWNNCTDKLEVSHTHSLWIYLLVALTFAISFRLNWCHCERKFSIMAFFGCLRIIIIFRRSCFWVGVCECSVARIELVYDSACRTRATDR